ATVDPSRTAWPGVGHRPWPRGGNVAAFRPVASPTVYDREPLALVFTDMDLRAVIEFVDAIEVQARPGFDGKESITMGVEALDDAGSRAGIGILNPPDDDRYRQAARCCHSGQRGKRGGGK